MPQVALKHGVVPIVLKPGVTTPRIGAGPSRRVCRVVCSTSNGNGVVPSVSPPPAVVAAPNNVPNAPVPWYDSHRQQPSYRSVFDFKFWVAHRNPMRYFVRLLRTTQSSVLRNVLPAVCWVATVAAILAAYTTSLQAGVLPVGAPDVAKFMQPVAQAFITNTTIAMSLLLVFRTTQSYLRWDESRKFWGATLNRSRDIARQCVTLFPESDQAAKDMFIRWMVAFCKAMHRHFQNEGSLEQDLKSVLTERELKMLLGSTHRPMKCLHVLGEIIMQVPMAPIHQQQMSHNLQHFHDQLGASERLLRTPIPISYTRHASRFLMMWLTLLPFALYPSMGWSTIFLVAMISTALLKIDEIGIQIEEPFSILPLDVISGRITTDVMSTLKDDQQVKGAVRSMISDQLHRQASLTRHLAYA